MKKIKFLSMAMIAMMVCAGFTACGDDDDTDNNTPEAQETPTQKENFAKYMEQVEKQVKDKKSASKNKKALLLVAFGSTWENAHNTFKTIVKDYTSEFKDYDVFFSFTSAICINRSRAGEHYASQDYYAPNFWLEAIGRQKYEEVRVQSLHVIPGEEFLRLRDSYIKDFKNNIYGDLDQKYLDETVKVFIGGPLMAEEDDVKDLAKALDAKFSQYVTGNKVMAFMGHGNPAEYNYGNGNIRYEQLEKELQTINPRYYVATVDMKNFLLENMWGRMEGKIQAGTTITLHALMCIAGDHAHNDMSGIENEGDSWREFFQEKGFKCAYDGNDANTNNNCILKGLGDYDTIRDIWIEHTRNAEEMFVEEEEEEE